MQSCEGEAKSNSSRYTLKKNLRIGIILTTYNIHINIVFQTTESYHVPYKMKV